MCHASQGFFPPEEKKRIIRGFFPCQKGVCGLYTSAQSNINNGWSIKLLLFPNRLLFYGAGEVTEWLKVHAWNACVRKYREFESHPLRQLHIRPMF